MNFYNTIHKALIQPASDIATGWNVSKHMDFLDDSQWWSRDQLVDYQLSRLKKLLAFANNHTEFYKKLFADLNFDPYQIKDISELKRLPVISKEQVQDALPAGISAIHVLHKRDYHYTATSGSTGLQLKYYISSDAYGFINAAALRGWEWMGFRLGDPYVKISQNKRKSRVKRLQDLINRCYLFSHEYSEEGFKAFVDLLVRHKPQFIRSYPDPLLFIANYLMTHHVDLPEIKAINTTGNTLFKETREIIEKTFNAKIFDSYSCEGSAQVFECETHDCYHISDEYAITEIIDEQGNEVKPGERGRLITTDLWNYATPFIRYDTNDFVVKGEGCRCGRNLGTIRQIEGRNNDILVTPQGQYLIGQNFTTYFKYYGCIKQFLVTQENPDELIFSFVVTDHYTNAIENEIIQYWKNYLNHLMKIRIQRVDEIPLRFSGKRQFLQRNPSIKLYKP